MMGLREQSAIEQYHTGQLLLCTAFVVAGQQFLRDGIAIVVRKDGVFAHLIGRQKILKQIGLGFKTYAIDHDSLLPWLVLPPEGIKGPSTVRAQSAFYCFAYASNELVSPKILVCPSDKETKVTALDFGGVALTGLQWGGFANNAVSYFAGLDADEKRPETILSGDRNIKLSLPTQNCGTVLVTANPLLASDAGLQFTNSIHVQIGLLGMMDGSVQTVTATGLRRVVQDSEDPSMNNHIVLPK